MPDDTDTLPPVEDLDEEIAEHDAREAEEVERYFFFRSIPTDFDHDCPF